MPMSLVILARKQRPLKMVESISFKIQKGGSVETMCNELYAVIY